MSTFPFQITYTSNRNAYAKISEQGIVIFSIPARLKNNKQFIDKLFLQAEKLRQKHSKRTNLTKRDENWILLFGEQVPRSELDKITFSSSSKTIENFLKTELNNYAIDRLDIYSTQINKPYHSLTIRKAKSKRGSCSHDQKIMLNLNLIFLSPFLIRYVIAHETAHLIHKHHQQSFRDLVSQLFPDYKKARKTLRSLIISSIE